MQHDLRAVIDVKKVWEFGSDDLGCVSLFRGNAEESFGVLGDIVENGSVSMPNDMIASFAKQDGTFVHPQSFELLWSSSACSLWRPIPPEGFVAIGDLIQRGIHPPDLTKVVCVHKSLVLSASLPFEANRSCIWPNLLKDPLPKPPISIWRIQAPEEPSANGEPYAFPGNYFIANPSFERPKSPVYAVSNPLFKPLPQNNNTKQQEQEATPEELQFWEKSQPNTSPAQPLEKTKIELFDMQRITEVEYLPTLVTPEQALNAFENWLTNLWFAPIEVRNKPVHPESLEFRYFPFYVFDTIAETKIIKSEIDDENSASVPFTTRHSDILYSATDENQIEELLNGTTAWDLSKIELFPRDTFEPLQLDTYKNPNVVWKLCNENLIVTEAKEHGNEESRVCTKFQKTHFRLLLVPFYIAEFEHENNLYRFVVNGQHGTCNGSRPFNLLGGLSRLWGTSERPGVYSGYELQKKERNLTLYEKDLHYLVFPASKSSIFSYHIGWFKLHNKSKEIIQIRGKERKGKLVGIIYPLPPGDSQCFPYKGNWVVEIMSGNEQMIHLKGQSPTGGESFANVLGMA